MLQLTACLLPNNSLRISRQNSRAGLSLLAVAAASVCVLLSATGVLSVESFLDFFVNLPVSCVTLLADDDDGLVMVGVGDESNGVSYGDVLMTAAPGVVVSAFRFTPCLVYSSTDQPVSQSINQPTNPLSQTSSYHINHVYLRQKPTGKNCYYAIPSPRVASWCCGRASDSRSRGCGFESRPGTMA